MKSIYFLAGVMLCFMSTGIHAQVCPPGKPCIEPAQTYEDCAELAPIVSADNLPLEFIAASDIRDGFYAISPQASVSVDLQGTAVLNLRNSGNPISVGITPVADKSLRITNGDISSQVIMRTSDDAEWPKPLKGFSSISVGQLREGVSARYQGRGRALVINYTISSELRDKTVSTRLSGEGLKLNMGQGSSVSMEIGSRTIPVYVKAYQTTEQQRRPVEVDLSVGDDVLKVTPHDVHGNEPVTVSVELLHAEFSLSPAAVLPNGNTIVSGSGIHPLRGDSQAFATLLDSTGKRITSVVWGNEGEDDAVSVTRNGDSVFVLGTTESEDRTQDITITEFDEYLRPVRASLLPSRGNDRAIGISGGGQSPLYVLAEMGERDTFRVDPLPALTTLLPVRGNRRPPRELTLVALDSVDMKPIAIQNVPVADDVAPTIWVDCNGIPIIGVEILNPLMTCDEQTFDIPPRANDFTNGFVENAQSWGQMLLQWKQFNASYQAAGSPAVPPPSGDPAWTTVAFNPANATAAPQGNNLDAGLGAGHASQLNSMEANSNIFPGGDPNGGWNFGNADDLAEYGIAVGLYADCCNSPVAAAVNYDGTHQPIVAMGVEYCIHGGVFSQINDLIMDWDNGLTWHPDNNPMDYVDQLWATQYGNSLLSNDYYQVTEIYASHWDGGTFAQNQTIAAPELDDFFVPVNIGDPVATDYLGDPPVPLTYGSQVAQELAQRMSFKSVNKSLIERVSFVQGQQVTSSVKSQTVLSSRINAQ